MDLPGHPHVGVLRGAAIDADGLRMQPVEVHDDSSEMTVFLGSDEQYIHLTPGS